MTTTHYTKPSITAECAEQMIQAAVAKSKELGLAMVIAILDESALLKAFYRMDGAPLISIEMAQNKAYSSATFPRGQSTSDIYHHIQPLPPVLATFQAMPRYSLIGGGFPIKVDGQVIGSIGVSGGNAEQDIAVAQAALSVLG